MNIKTAIGIALILLGVIGFIFKGITYTETEQVVDFGPIEMQAEHEERIPLTPLASGAALLAGLGLVVVGRKRG